MDKSEMEAWVLLTTRNQLHEGKDFRYVKTLTEADLDEPEWEDGTDDDDDDDDFDLMEEILKESNFNGYFYHTTSNHAAAEILKTCELKPKNYDSFVSFSTKPLPNGDIESRDVTLVFRNTIAPQLLEVDYDESWFHEHPNQGRYIAGEGWQEQFFFEPDEDMDEFDIDDAEEEARSNAEIDAFIDKSDEDEWISRTIGAPVKFRKEDVCMIIVNHAFSWSELDQWNKELSEWGYKNVSVIDRK
jgi:hypothetical protein